MTGARPYHPAAKRWDGGRRGVAATVAATLALVAGASCGGAKQPPVVVPAGELAPPIPLVVTEPFFVPGEQLRWQVKMHGMVGAESVLVVGEPGVIDGHRVIIVKSRALSTGLIQLVKAVREENTTWIALDEVRPLERHGDEKYGDERRIIEVHFRPGEVVYDAKRPGRPPYSWRQVIPDNQYGHDVHSILGLLRAWVPTPGVQVFFYSVTDEILRFHAVHLGGFEPVTTALGSAEAVRLEVVVYAVADDGSRGPREPDQDYTVWLSRDATRRPLRMKLSHRLGRLDLELVGYTRP